jgi:fatty acid desaturase
MRDILLCSEIKRLNHSCFQSEHLYHLRRGWLSRHTYTHHSYPNIVNLDKDINSIIDKKLLTKIKNNRKSISIFLILHFVTYMILSKLFFFIVKTEIHIIIFFLIFALFTQVNHIHNENFTGSPHFYKHQIITATNIKTDSYLMRILSGGLNCQIEHHLFPSVNSCHLPEIAKIVKPLCIKYNIPYNEYSSFTQALSDTYTTSKKINSKTICDYNFINLNK